MMGVLHLLLLLLVPCSLHTDTSCEAEVGAKDGAKEGCGCAGSRQHGDTAAAAGGQEAAGSSSNKYSAAANTESGDTGPRTNTMEPVPGATFTMGTDKPVFAADR